MNGRLPLRIAGPVALATALGCWGLIALAVTHPLIGLSVIAGAAAVAAGLAWLGRALDAFRPEMEG